MALKLRKKKVSIQADALDHQRLTSLINSMADAVLAVDEEADTVMYNAAALNIFDVNTIRAGTPLARIFKPIDKNNQPVDIKGLVKVTSTPYTSRDLRLKYDDGSVINLYLSIAPVHLGYGEGGQSGHVLLLRDITREKSLEEERDEFISVASHELRTPIAIAEGNIGNAEYIAGKAGDMGAIKKALAEAHAQVLFLAALVNDLSTLSRAERGKLQVDVESIEIKPFLAQLVDGYQSQAKSKNLTISCSAADGLKLDSSRLYVQEIIQNFITNSLKYTHEGNITVSAKPDPKGVIFSVADTGIGISKSDQERVFDKFFRSEDFRTRQVNGTGLGLYVTSKLARLIHAEINLDSELDKGSEFTIFVPNLRVRP